MMKFKRTVAGALALITVLGAFAGCAQNSSNNNGSTAGGNNSTATSAANGENSESSVESQYGQNLETDSDVQDKVDSLEVSDENYANIKVDTKLVWMAWWEIQEASPAVEVFKKFYGTPANKPEGFEDVDDANVFCNVNIANYGDRYNALALRVQSGDSPDCFPFEISNYPYSVAKMNLFQPVDGLFDFTTDDWAAYKEYIDMFNWGGKNYCPIMSLVPTDVLWYRKSIVEEYGFDNPWELYETGEWTWSKFLDMAKAFTDPENGKYAIDGWYQEASFICTTGLPLIGLVDGKLVSNLNDANIEKVQEMLQRFDDSQESFRYPREIENGWNPSQSDWVNGNTLFYDDGTWRYEEHWYKFKKKQKWDDDEIQMVPFPQMDGADKYYHSMKQDAIMLCAGAKNLDGYKAWIYANLVASNDEEVKAAGREQSKTNYDWTDMLLDNFDVLQTPGTLAPVFDFKNGIGHDIADTQSMDNPIGMLTSYPCMNGESYTQLRAENAPIIEARLEELNKTIA